MALRLAQDPDLPLAGIVPIGPAGMRMAPAFFTLDRIPAVSRIIGLPAPVPPQVTRSVAGRLYRQLAFADPNGVDKAVVDRFTRFHVDRPVIRERIDYAKRLRAELDDPFDGEAIKVPVSVIWGEVDRLCPAEGAELLAERLPHARDRDAARRRPHAADRGARGRRRRDQPARGLIGAAAETRGGRSVAGDAVSSCAWCLCLRRRVQVSVRRRRG